MKDVAHVSRGPTIRRGALDKGGAEAVGGVAVVRYGFNPLEAIKNIKQKIEELSPGLPTKAIIDYSKTTRDEVQAYADRAGFHAFNGVQTDHDAWVKHLKSTPRHKWPAWVTTSHLTVVPFYDRTGLIYETLGTLNTALTEEILVTIIVILISVMHLRSSLLISALLPLAVLICFIAMKTFHVDANIVALSGIAIAIGTMVDMGIILCENILRHLAEADPDEDRREVIFRASREVGGAVLTAVSTTIVSFLPVFTMIGPEGKLFKPLAFTKTFALAASVIVALTIIPPLAHVLFTGRIKTRLLRRIFLFGLVAGGIGIALFVAWWAGLILALIGGYYLVEKSIPTRHQRLAPIAALLKEVGSVEPNAVIADRIVGKPYLEPGRVRVASRGSIHVCGQLRKPGPLPKDTDGRATAVAVHYLSDPLFPVQIGDHDMPGLQRHSGRLGRWLSHALALRATLVLGLQPVRRAYADVVPDPPRQLEHRRLGRVSRVVRDRIGRWGRHRNVPRPEFLSSADHQFR